MPSRKRTPALLLCTLLLPSLLSACGSPAPENAVSSPLPAVEAVASAGAGSSESASLPDAEPSRPSAPSPSPSLPPESSAAPSEAPEDSAAPTGTAGIPAATRAAVPLYAPAGAETLAGSDPALAVNLSWDVLAELPAGQQVSASATSDPLWYAVTLEDGVSGYLYGEDLYRVAEDGQPSPQSLFREYAEKTLAALREKLPEGKYWNHMGTGLPYGEESPEVTTAIPCDHSEYGETYCNFYNGKLKELFPDNTICQCMGFASYLSDSLFGSAAGIHVFSDYTQLRLGDHIRLREYEHSMTVVEKTEEFITVAEVNRSYEDCLISWSRRLTVQELASLSWDIECYSRYPFRLGGDGARVLWEES